MSDDAEVLRQFFAGESNSVGDYWHKSTIEKIIAKREADYAALQSALAAREAEVAGLAAYVAAIPRQQAASDDEYSTVVDEMDVLWKRLGPSSRAAANGVAEVVAACITRAEAAEARALALETLLREARKTYIPVPNPTSVRVARLPHRMDFIARVDAALTPTTTGENDEK